MLDGNLMDYVGRNVKCNGKNGKITGLMHVDAAKDAFGAKSADDQVFEVTWDGGQVDEVAARSSVLEELGYDLD